MSDDTGILSQTEVGFPTAAAELLPLVYNELRDLASARLFHEPAGQTLQTTALVHEAYLRLVGNAEGGQAWENRGHFFAAAAKAMRRILIENARRKGRIRHGGDRLRLDLDASEIAAPEIQEDLLALDSALDRLAIADPAAARLVNLRYFAGLTVPEAARILGMSPRSTDRLWAYARAWLYRELYGTELSPGALPT